MKKLSHPKFQLLQVGWYSFAFFVCLLMTFQVSHARDSHETSSFDGLVLKENKRNLRVFLNPNANFGSYDKVQIQDVAVAFKKNWKRDFNRKQTGSLGNRIKDRDVAKIRADMSANFNQIFYTEFNDNGYPVVDEPAEDVLLIRPALINVDLYNPVTNVGSRVFGDSTGTATIYIELFDSVSGEILARIIERREIGDYHFHRWINKQTSKQEGLRLLKRWARQLREHFDLAHKENDSSE